MGKMAEFYLVLPPAPQRFRVQDAGDVAARTGRQNPHRAMFPTLTMADDDVSERLVENKTLDWWGLNDKVGMARRVDPTGGWLP